MASIVDIPDWLRKKLLGASGRGLPFSPQAGVDELGRAANIDQYLQEHIGLGSSQDISTPDSVFSAATAEQEPMMQRTDVASHLDAIGRIQANRNKWDARVGAFGGRMSWGDLPDITKQAKFQDEMIRDEIISRQRQAILAGDIKDITGWNRWYKSQGFDPHFAGDARKAATAILDQLMQEEGREESKQKHVWAGETRGEQRTAFTQSQLDRASTQAADLQSEKVQNKIGEMISGFSGIWAEDAGDYDKAEYREREIRYDVNQLEGYSESEKQTIFANVMEGLQAQTAQVGRFEVADQEMQVAQEQSRLQALQDAQNEEYRTTEATRRENQISNAGVQMLNELVAGGMDEQQATNQVIQQMSQWATDPNFLGLRESAGEWVPKEPVTVGTVEDAGMKASQPAGAVPLDAAAINQAFLQQVGTRAEQAAAVREPAAYEFINTAIQKLADTGDPAKNSMNIQTVHAAIMDKSGQDSPFWYDHSEWKRRYIGWNKTMGYAKMAQPGRIDPNAILREYETSEALKQASEVRDQSKKLKGEERAAAVQLVESIIEDEIKRIVERWNWPEEGIMVILFPDMFDIGVSAK